MNYLESAAYIESLSPTILNPDLTRFKTFMAQHGNLQDSFPTIHVAGTNGKGSVVAITESVLRCAGLKTGRFTGPHLLRWNERFHVDGQPIPDHLFAQLCTELQDASEKFGKEFPEFGHLTWFEFLTAIAFFWFARKNVDIGVIEVGLGGRWDATNVISKPTVTAITTIDYDHMHILGNSIEEIAREKAGIIKSQIPLVTGTTNAALDVIAARAAELSAPLYVVDAEGQVDGATPVDLRAFLQARSRLALPGAYQRLNASIASCVLALAQSQLGLNLDERMLQQGFASTYWPGRFQVLSEQKLIMDGAHNPGGARALRQALDSVEDGGQRPPGLVFVLSFFETKDVSKYLRELLRPGDVVFCSQAITRRAVCKAEHIVELARELNIEATACDTIGDALSSARRYRRDDQVIVATGSLATVKECMQALGWQSVEDGVHHGAGSR